MAIKPVIFPLPRNIQEQQLYQALSEFVINVRDTLNGGVVLTENLNGETQTFTSPATPDEFSVAHTRNKIPTGHIVIQMDKPGSVYRGTTAWTKTHIYLQCDAGTASGKILIF